ncbi:MAG: hypothetical protein KDA61_13500 [Planctomycetales bacterium]|nr:hypothetical protein [Planctomycetales bacterium]
MNDNLTSAADIFGDSSELARVVMASLAMRRLDADNALDLNWRSGIPSESWRDAPSM